MNEHIPKPVPHYLQSIGSIVESDGSKKTAYFYPSLIFPNSIELCSVSLLYSNKSSSEIKINLAIQKTINAAPISDDCLKHKVDELVTTTIYGKPKLINAHEPFYFYHDGELKDSSIVITFKTIN